MIEKILRNKKIIAFALAVFIWWKHGEMGEIKIDKAIFIAAVIFISIALVDLWQKSWMYDSSHFVCPNLHASVNMRNYPIKGYICFTLGGVDTDFIFEGKDGTCILPERFVWVGHKVMFSLISVHETPFNRLPSSVQEFILQNKGIFLPPYFYGELPITDWQENAVRADELDQMIKVVNSSNAYLRKENRTLAQEVETLVSHTERIKGRVGFLKRIFEANKDDDRN